jgi:hypothetical protein
MIDFQKFHELVKHSRYFFSSYQSFVATFFYSEYLKMFVEKVQNILREKHILIIGIPTSLILFDSKNLQTLTNLDAKIDIQGELV